MRVLLVSPCFPPQDNIASLRACAFARHWSDAGEEVAVLTTAKDEAPAGSLGTDDQYSVAEISYDVPLIFRALRRREHQAGKVIAQNTGSIAVAEGKPGPLRRLRDRTGVFSAVRMPDLTDGWVKPAIAWCRKQPPWDVVISSSGPYTAHLVGLELERLGLARCWVTDFRDLWVNNHLYRGLFPFTLRERVLQRRCLAQTDLVTTVSEELAETLRSQTRANVEVVYNGFDPEEAESLPQSRIFPDDGNVRLVYTGTLYRDGQNPAPLLEAMRTLRQDNPDLAGRLRLVVVGRGYEYWANLARQYEVAELVEAREAVERPEALRMQRDADALVLVDWNDPKAGVLTGKLFEYLSVRAPILVVGGSAESAMARMVGKVGRGFHLGIDVQRIIDALTSLLTAPQLLHTEPNHERIASFTRRSQSLRLLEMIRETAPSLMPA